MSLIVKTLLDNIIKDDYDKTFIQDVTQISHLKMHRKKYIHYLNFVLSYILSSLFKYEWNVFCF